MLQLQLSALLQFFQCSFGCTCLIYVYVAVVVAVSVAADAVVNNAAVVFNGVDWLP